MAKVKKYINSTGYMLPKVVAKVLSAMLHWLDPDKSTIQVKRL